MVTALYRRYRPETFSELIGQSQVTDPLRAALRTDRVGHAYLFSGPRGCGKTTSARILARCLNCAAGPTDEPCGVCASCLELARGGPGSLDVIEIDAASHNGVDDARDLRDRAAYAPARDRFKIFILDEAHMVTAQGFNAMLKLVEEPPDHVKFIFATTEPDKVIGTIRSRTHHYPFRLVPPAAMLDYTQQLAEQEGVKVQAGVLPLVVRAGGGSVRDTLSLLDQLIAGSEGDEIVYERAVALLGYTHAALLDEVVEALGARDAKAAFGAVDRVIQTGQDPRRFVEDLLERLRDLIVVAATREAAASVLRGVPEDELQRMSVQAAAFGAAELSHAADVVNQALTELTGATSPRLHLELMVARLLVPSADATGALARVERLERRIGIEDASPAPKQQRVEEVAQHSQQRVEEAAERPSRNPASAPAQQVEEAPQKPSSNPPAEPPASAPVTLQQLKDAWPEVLDGVQSRRRSAWMVVAAARVRDLQDDVLTLEFANEADVNGFKERAAGTDTTSEHLRSAIQQVLGIRVKFIARQVAGAQGASAPPPPSDEPEPPEPDLEPADDGWYVAPIPGAAGAEDAAATAEGASSGPDARKGRSNSGTPRSGDPSGSREPAVPELRPSERATPDAASTAAPASAAPASASASASARASAPPAQTRRPPRADQSRRYGEAVVRELLGANFIEETTIERAKPTVRPAEDEG